MSSKKSEPGSPKKSGLKLLYLVAIFFIIIDLIVCAYLIFQEYYKNRIYPGISVGQVYIGSMTEAEAAKILEAKINDFSQDGITFNYENNIATVTPIISSFNGELALKIITFDTDETANQAFNFGRKGNIAANIWNQFLAIKHKKNINAVVSFDDKQIAKTLAYNFGKYEQPASNARLTATSSIIVGKKDTIFRIEKEKYGFTLDYEAAIERMKNELRQLNFSSISLNAIKGYPTIKAEECQEITNQASDFLAKANLSLTYKEKKWQIEKPILATWLTIARGIDSKIIIDLDGEKISNYINKKISPEIDVLPIDSRFQIKDNRVVEFTKSQDGLKVSTEKTFASLRSGFLTDNSNAVEISTELVKSAIESTETKDLGITEIIGTGHSNFSGSPKNRIVNINVGAASMNGLLIAPGTEFSVDTSLGLVDATTGYLPEMTIKGDKTVPEYGGGLCQIGTTIFRAALNSGFPITARAAHSYRVAYYEPAGTDATIYQPWPDLRFINDSSNYILIQSRISGNDLYFDFWGTKDGRVVEQTDPTVSNIVKPLPTKIVETLSLKPGEKKCTERAHNGADAFFDYKVTYSDGTTKSKRFTSHYVPWREVCLIGVEKLSASSTPEIAQ